MESGICPNCGVENDFSNLPAFARINCEECGTVLIIPKIFKNYQLTEIVEEYKFFKKCRGFDLNSDAKVNVLLLNKKFPDFRLCLKFCTEEADFLIKNLPDENVVPIIEHGIEEGTFYAITPDIECFKLSQYDPEVLGEFEVQSVFAAFKMVASILNTLHEKKIVHHNICPENILIDNEGNVKIDNFLTSRVIYKYESGSRADSSVSHYYVSPEKLYKKSEDSKGDIFSTGVLLYYILTGRFPFDGDSKEEILYSRVKTSSNKNSIIKQNFKYREPIPVTRGTKTLKDAVDSAFEAYLKDPVNSLYAIGSVVGPHPFPMMVRDFQKVVGEEAKTQFKEMTGKLPDYLMACVGGGSNAIGLFTDFLNEDDVEIIGVEPAGKGLDTNDHAATLSLGTKGSIHGFKCYNLQDDKGNPLPVYSIASGLDYPGVGPQHCYLKDINRVKYVTVDDKECLDAFMELSRSEGIIPALESAHAIAYAMKFAKELPNDKSILVNLSGRGDKDVDFVVEELGLK